MLPDRGTAGNKFKSHRPEGRGTDIHTRIRVSVKIRFFSNRRRIRTNEPKNRPTRYLYFSPGHVLGARKHFPLPDKVNAFVRRSKNRPAIENTMLRHEASRFLIKAIVKGDQREVGPVRIKLWKNLGSGREEALNGDTGEREKRKRNKKEERKKERKKESPTVSTSQPGQGIG